MSISEDCLNFRKSHLWRRHDALRAERLQEILRCQTPTLYSSDVAFTPAVKAIQARKGSREAYAQVGAARRLAHRDRRGSGGFLAETRTASFWRPPPPTASPISSIAAARKGFIKILDKNTLAFADYSGNRQYITQGNLSENPKAHIFLMDYAHRRRVKIWGEARVVDDDPALLQSLMPQATRRGPSR